MEGNAREHLEYWISIPVQFEESLFLIRNMIHLKMAKDFDHIWIRGFTEVEINNASVLQLNSISRFYLKNTHLFKMGERLPYCIEPSLLWTPIQRFLKLSLPKENFNLFDYSEEILFKIKPSKEIIQTNVSVLSVKDLSDYVRSAPRIRLSHLKWTILNNQKAMIIGLPILPINGEDYYLKDGFIIPCGWKPEFENIISHFQNLLEMDTFYYLVETDHSLLKIKKSSFTFLSRGSVKLSIGPS